MKPPAKQSKQPKSDAPQPDSQAQVSVEWQGPLPPPAVLEQFDKLIPGGADRVMRMAEQEQAHRFALENQLNSSNDTRANRGQICGALLAALSIVAAIANTYLGGPWQVGVALVGVPILGVAKALINTRR